MIKIMMIIVMNMIMMINSDDYDNERKEKVTAYGTSLNYL